MPTSGHSEIRGLDVGWNGSERGPEPERGSGDQTMNTYTYEVTLIIKGQHKIYDIKATSELNAVIEAVKTYGPVNEIFYVSRIR